MGKREGDPDAALRGRARAGPPPLGRFGDGRPRRRPHGPHVRLRRVPAPPRAELARRPRAPPPRPRIRLHGLSPPVGPEGVLGDGRRDEGAGGASRRRACGVAPHGRRARRRGRDADALLRAPRRAAAAPRICLHRCPSPSPAPALSRGTDDGTRPQRAVLPVPGGARRRRDSRRHPRALLARRAASRAARKARRSDGHDVRAPPRVVLPAALSAPEVLQGPARADRHRGSSGSLDTPPRARAVARPRRLAPAPGPPARPRGGRRSRPRCFSGFSRWEPSTHRRPRPRVSMPPRSRRRTRAFSAASLPTRGAAARRATGRRAGRRRTPRRMRSASRRARTFSKAAHSPRT